MSKYIIDTGDYLFTTDGVLVVGFDCDNKPATFYNSLDTLEELNSDYINEHYGDLQDEAYQRGLVDAWEATKKIFGYEIDGGIPIDEIGKVFGYAEGATFCTADIFRHNTVIEAIEKLKAYEEKQKEDEIKVGDEVKQVTESGTETGLLCTVTAIDGDHMNGISQDGRAIVCSSQVNRWWKKTGRHFNIASILEDMRND